jgi:hypothetical protein
LAATIGLTMSANATMVQTSNSQVSNDSQFQPPPVEDNAIFYHMLFNQLEGRTNGPDNEFRWDGEGWVRPISIDFGSSPKASSSAAR